MCLFFSEKKKKKKKLPQSQSSVRFDVILELKKQDASLFLSTNFQHSALCTILELRPPS